MSRPTDSWLYAGSATLWAKERLGFVADSKQAEFLDCNRSDIILLWCRQSGKSTCAGIKTAHSAVFKPASLSLIVSATQRQAGILQKVVLRALRQNLRNGKGWRETKSVQLPSDPLDSDSQLVRCSVLSLELGNGSEVVSVPASPDTVRGYSPNLIVLDEAARIKGDTVDAIRPMRAAKEVQLIALSTPAGRRGWFYSEWFSSDPVWFKSSMSADECPRITDAFLQREREKVSREAIFNQEYFLAFIEPAGSIFSAAQIESMFEPIVAAEQGRSHPVEYAELKTLETEVAKGESFVASGPEFEPYGRVFCSKCGHLHNPLDRCKPALWKIPQ